MVDIERKPVELPQTGVHVLPFMSDPSILSKSSEPRFVAIELTPVENGVQTEARCQIAMTREDAVRLAILIAEQALQSGWPFPEGSVIHRTIQ